MQREFARLYMLNGGFGRHAALEAGYSPLTADRAAQQCLTLRLVGAGIQRLSIINLSAKLPQLIGYLLGMAEIVTRAGTPSQNIKWKLIQASFFKPAECGEPHAACSHVHFRRSLPYHKIQTDT
jgi:hypothetical protein